MTGELDSAPQGIYPDIVQKSKSKWTQGRDLERQHVQREVGSGIGKARPDRVVQSGSAMNSSLSSSMAEMEEESQWVSIPHVPQNCRCFTVLSALRPP